MDDQFRAIIGTQSFTKFCPTCKFGNDANALTCLHCGRSLDLFTKSLKSDKEDQYTIPQKGMALYFIGNSAQITVNLEEQFILGREAEEGDVDPLVDLSKPDGFAMGVSRRHARIRLTESGYEITDLNSSNGTWLNGKILPPSQPTSLPNGGIIQLGRLKLIAVYNAPIKE